MLAHIALIDRPQVTITTPVGVVTRTEVAGLTLRQTQAFKLIGLDKIPPTIAYPVARVPRKPVSQTP